MVKDIDLITAGLKEHCNSNDVFEICNFLNIQIKYVCNNHIMLQGNDAMYVRFFKNNEYIFIRDDLDYQYSLFVIAHEIGHAILHIDTLSAAFNKSLLNIGKYEKEANQFAFKLLDINIDPIEDKNLTIEQLSRKYHIPIEAIKLENNQ